MGSVSFQSERQKADYLKNIFANVYLKDVIERNKIQNVDEIGILVDVLASAIGAPPPLQRLPIPLPVSAR
jgi:predicted AAA+ superfamily ATPase